MADGMNIHNIFEVNNNGIVFKFSPASTLTTWDTPRYVSGTVLCTTSGKVLSTTDIDGNESFFFCKHIGDSTATIHIAVQSTVAGASQVDFCELRTRMFGCFPMEKSTTFVAYTTATASTSGPTVQWSAFST